MSNLTDLLPAGAGGKQVSFVASGTLGSGQTVALNSDGTVSGISAGALPPSVGDSQTFYTGNNYNLDIAYDSGSNVIVIVFRDGSSPQYGACIVGQVATDGSVTWGSKVFFHSGTTYYSTVAYDVNANKVVISYRDASNSNYATIIVGTVSGTSISFGSEYIWSTTRHDFLDITYSNYDNKCIVSGRNSTNKYVGTCTVTISGTAASFGSYTYAFSEIVDSLRVDYFAGQNTSATRRIIYAMCRNNTSVKLVPAYISGTSLVFGGTVTASTSAPNNISLAYDSTNQRMICSYQYNNGGTYLASVFAATVISGAITTGSTTVLEYANSAYNMNSCDFPAGSGSLVSYRDDDATSYVGTSVIITGTGTTISVGTPFTFSDLGYTGYIESVYDPDTEQAIIAYADQSGSNDGMVVAVGAPQSNNVNFIGITDAAISDTASGSVTIKGGISTNVTGLTPNSTYYVQDDGSLSTTASDVLAGKALSSTSINLDYTS